MQYKEILQVNPITSQFIDLALNSTDFMGEDDTIVETAEFNNGYQMDIKCCGAQEDVAWTEAVLFDERGRQVSYTEPSDEFLGEWELEDDAGNSYCVTVELLKGERVSCA